MPESYSIVNDAALFLGDVMIERCPGLRWEFFTGGKKDAAYQHHVIMGFTRLPNPKFNVDIDRNVATYAHRIIASRGSIATYAERTVRGVEINVDAAADMPIERGRSRTTPSGAGSRRPSRRRDPAQLIPGDEAVAEPVFGAAGSGGGGAVNEESQETSKPRSTVR